MKLSHNDMTSRARPGDVTGEECPQSKKAVLRHRRGNRWMHWVNFPLITIMVWSGLRIYWAFDEFSLGVGDWQIFAFFPDWFNEALGLDRKLARGIAFHLSFGWVFVFNGLAYVSYLAVTGGWRQLVPTLSQLRRTPAVLLHEVGLRNQAPPSETHYNAAQQLTYTIVVVVGFVVALSGFALFRPVQLSFLVAMFGGFQGARLVHFGSTMFFVGFFFVHIFQVVRAGRANFLSMVTGYEVVETQPQGSFAAGAGQHRPTSAGDERELVDA